MSSIRIDGVAMSSAFASFGYEDVISTTLLISGSVPDGGKTFSVSVTVPESKFLIAYYRNPDYTDIPNFANKRLRVDNLPYAFVDSPISSTIKGSQSSTTYTVTVFFGAGAPVTAATQTLYIDIYVFSSPLD